MKNLMSKDFDIKFWKVQMENVLLYVDCLLSEINSKIKKILNATLNFWNYFLK